MKQHIETMRVSLAGEIRAEIFKWKTIYLNFAFTRSQSLPSIMIQSETLITRTALAKREMEIQQLLRQMTTDGLADSPVYLKLKQELADLKSKMIQIP
jgi:hypothetical protein